ncbi:MAG: adenylosuccinate synthase [Polyangiaceae bacterium]
MSVTAIVGANWGDEGKGRMVDALVAQGDVVVRFQGGGNAGHTVITERGKFVLHLLPSGVLREGTINVLGPGVALDAELVARELAGLRAREIEPRLLVSERAQLLLAHHRRLDAAEEDRLAAHGFGSTRSGIAPFYADQRSKIGVGVDDLVRDDASLRARIAQHLTSKNVLLRELYGQPEIEPAAVLAELRRARSLLAPFVADTTRFLHGALRSGRHVVLEGQLGALRDTDHGIQPWVTSSSTLAGHAAVGAGIPAAAITRVVAVTKAYSSAVGAGPFVSELQGDAADELRARGGDAGEYGATTGRPRRVGWFDAVATRYGCRLQGASEVALTGLDVLGYLDRIPICTRYQIDGEPCEDFPTTRLLERSEPLYEQLPGWRAPLAQVKRFVDLPPRAQAYVERIEELIEVPIRWISFGPARHQLLERTS